MHKRTAKVSDQVLEEASAWFVDFNESQVDRVGCEEFNAWLRRSPECVRAFLQVSAFWEDAAAFEKWSKIDTDGLIARALAERNVVHLEPVSQDHPAARLEARDELTNKRHVAGRRVNRAWLAAASMVLAVGLGIATWHAGYFAPTYTTGIGEQRSILLEDGSTVELNARSRLRVRFSEKLRAVDLVEGQALFTVAKNPARPFVVSTDETSVRAVGTRFDVYRKRAGTVVTVVEGRVAVNPTQRTTRGSTPAPAAQSGQAVLPAKRELLMGAGEQVTISPVKAALPASVDTSLATAWTEKKLVFDSTPLRDVVDEFNRYNRQQLVVRDADLFELHVSGVFPSTDSRLMVEFLRQRFGVSIDDSGEAIEIFARQPSPAAEEAKTF